MRNKPVRKLLVACVAGALFLPNKAFTLGLGEIEVNSALNQQLDADIELLSAAPEDADSLIVKLASRQAFSRAGLDRPFMLNDLRFKTVVIDDTPHIKISTKSPIREPFLNFLLEVDWPKGHLMREYTILLDPPTFMTQSNVVPAQTSGGNADAGFRPTSSGNNAPAVRPAAGVAPSASFRPATNQVAVAPASAPAQTSHAAAVVAAPRATPRNNQRPGEYRIQSGDTAWSLADAMRPDRSITVEQMMMAMLRANPESFINENINGLKRGYILRVPDQADIAAISPAQARAMVKEQAALWREYRQATAGGQPATAVDNATSASTDSAVDGAGSDDGARLKIVSAGSGASTSSSAKDPTQMSAAELREALAIAREKLETERVEKETLQQEVDQLEHQVSKMKGMLSIEGGELTDVQSLGGAGAETEGEVAGESQEVATDEAATGESTTDETGMAPDDVAGTEAGTEQSDAAGAEEAGIEETGMQEGDTEAPVFVDETGTPEGEAESDVAMPEEPAQPPVKPVAPVDITEREPTDPLTRLLNDPMMLAAGGGGLLLLLSLLYLVIKRRKAAADEAEPAGTEAASTDLEDIADMVEEDQLEDAAETVAEAADSGEEELDTESTMIMEAVDTSDDTVITEAAEEAEEEEEEPRDDVIAEADVYLAYGIYQQAEELLENAIKENPDRDDYRVKLAETYYASKNKDGFIEVATELRDRSQGADTPAWKKVVAMGQDMCADHELFQGSLVGGLDVDALAPKAPEMDFDLGMEESAEESPDIDLSLDEEPIDLPAVDESDAPAGEADEDLAELEFDLSETEALDETAVLESGDEEAVEAKGAEDDAAQDEEFSLDIDAAELDIDDDAAEAAKEDVEATMQVDSADLELDMDISEETAGAEAEMDADSLDIDFGLEESEPEEAEDEVEKAAAGDDESAEAKSPADEQDDTEATVMVDSDEIAIDLSAEDDELDIDFGLEESPQAEDDTVTEAEAATEEKQADDGFGDDELLDDEEEFDLSSLDDVDEISTKLDLARAYLDMGDHEGTREILEEVLTDGNDEQKKEANELMAQLET